MKRLLIILISVITVCSSCNRGKETPREQNFNFGWKFSLKADSNAVSTDYDDSQWRQLNLPHDWSIEGEFKEDNPATPGGGALPGGYGVYRKHFIPESKDSSKIFYIHFDGVYWQSTVYINGHKLGFMPNGYLGFEYDITPYLFFNQDNVIAVTVDNTQQPNSRWYSGSGIYRNTRLKILNPVHVSDDGIFALPVNVTDTKADVKLFTEIECSGNSQSVEITQEIVDAEGKTVVSSKSNATLTKGVITTDSVLLSVNSPILWDVKNSYLYQAVTTVKSSDGDVLDVVKTPFGIRYFEFNPDKGFILNGKELKIIGVCNHHDLGALGAAVNKHAILRQLKILKDMGCNGIRTSHNPPAPELLQLCDSLGFIVMDELYDMWAKKKTPYDYSRYFASYHEADIKSFIKRDRNHPCVFIWSVGNEILEQWPDINTDTLDIAKANLMFNFAAQISKSDNQTSQMHVNSLLAKKLVSCVKTLDLSRPVTTGNNETEPSNLLFKSGAMDIIGLNYHEYNWSEAFKQKYPGKSLIITESTSALMTRGYYITPADTEYLWPVRWDIPFSTDHHQCSSYDNTRAPWGSTHETTIKAMMKYPWCSGIYIWTGFDYLGEPTPYGWPSRSSYFGIIDLAGFPKDIYYLYQSLFTDKDVLHILPHWNWKQGDIVDVWVYSNFDTVELFLNNKSLGSKKLEKDELHYSWRVPFTAGQLKAVGKRSNGTSKTVEIFTAGNADHISLSADKQDIVADGEDLSFISLELLDKDNHFVPTACNKITYSVTGPAEIVATDCGNPICHESFKAVSHSAFNGKSLCIVKSIAGKSGKITIKAIADGVAPCEITLNSK